MTEGAPVHTPESVFVAAVAALRAEDWPGLVELCDPLSVRVLAERLRSDYSPERAPQVLTAEDYMKHAPDIPLAVAEYYALEAARAQDLESRRTGDFPTVASAADFLRLSAPDLLVAWMTGGSLRAQFERQVARGAASRQQADDALRIYISDVSHVILGVLPDGDRVAHVVYRYGGPGASQQLPAANADEAELQRDLNGRTYLQFCTCRKFGASAWGIVADYGLFGIGQGGFFVSEQEGSADEEGEL